VEDKRRSVRPKKLSTADEQCLKVMSLLKGDLFPCEAGRPGSLVSGFSLITGFSFLDPLNFLHCQDSFILASCLNSFTKFEHLQVDHLTVHKPYSLISQ